LIERKIKKAIKILIPSLVLLLIISFVLRSIFTYKSFKGEIVGLDIERYSAPDEPGFFLPSFTELGYRVKRIKIRTEKGGIIDLAAYINDLDEKSIGKRLKGTYKPGRILEIKGENVILGFIDFPGPKIELRGEPTGIMKKSEIIRSQHR